MRRIVLTALGAAVAAAPVPLLAQEEAPTDAPLTLEEQESDFSDMAERLQDPEKQRQMAMMLRTMSEVLLDLPLAPLMEALNDAGGSFAGEDAPEVDPDTTLRSLAPEAERVPEEIEKNLPRALDAMGSMAQAMEAMMPALQEMAGRMKEAAPRAD